MTAQIHERLIFDGEETSLACCPPLPVGHARIVASERGEAARDEHVFSSGCWRRYVATWQIKDGRFFLVRIRGMYKLLGEEPLFADWFTGVLTIPRGEMLRYVHADFLSVYEEEVHVRVENGLVVKSCVIDNRPHRGPAANHYETGRAWGLKGEYEKAISAFGEALRLHPDYADAYYARGLAYEAMADYDRSLADFDRLVQLEVIQGNAWHFARKDIDRAISRVYGHRGMAFLQKGDYETAVADFTESIRLEPESDVRLGRGRAYHALGRFKEAVQDLLVVARTNPDNQRVRFDIYSRLAHCYREIGAHELAILYAGMATRLDPNNPDAYHVRGG